MVKLYGTRICPLFLAVAVLPSCQRGEPVNNNKSDTEIEQALIITIPLSDGADGHSAERQHLFKLEDELMVEVEKSGAGEYDGNEIGQGTFVMYAYGPNADRLLDAALPVLAKYDLPQGSQALKRYGKPGARSAMVPIAKGTAH